MLIIAVNHVCNPAPGDAGEEQPDADAQGSSASSASSNGSEASNSPGRYVDVGVQADEIKQDNTDTDPHKQEAATVDDPFESDTTLPTIAQAEPSATAEYSPALPHPQPGPHEAPTHDTDLPALPTSLTIGV